MSLSDLVWLSNAGGMQMDWVQAGGGNTSIKSGDQLIIKASGLTLSEMTETTGSVTVDLPAVLDIMDDSAAPSDKAACDAWATQRLQDAVIGEGRPSMETYLHALLGTVVFHGHPWAINALTQNPSHLMAFQTQFHQHLHLPYETPGVHLGQRLKEALEASDFSDDRPRIITLANHGLIVDGPDAETVFGIVDTIVEWSHDLLGMTYEGRQLHDLSTTLNEMCNESLWVMRVQHYALQTISDQVVRELAVGPLIPDQQVFCGYHVLSLSDWDDIDPLTAYFEQYGEGPKCFLIDGQLFLRAKTVKKMREAEDVLWGCVQSLRLIDEPTFLSPEESHYLGNWEAEAYRKSV